MSLMDDPDFVALVAELSKPKPNGKLPRPNRFQVRALLLSLGTALLDEEQAPTTVVPEVVERVRALIAAYEDAWRTAVHDELALAVTEHVRSCDPSYLRLPNYDFPYTVEARERLEARLRAADELGLAADGLLLDQIEGADGILAPFLASRNSDTRLPPHQ